MNGAGRPRAILFDWDNTLVDNWQVICDAINQTLSAMGHETWTLDEAKGRIRASLRDSFPTMFGDRWPEARDIYYRTFTAHHLEALKPMAGAETLLRELDRLGIYRAVVSNKHGQYLRSEAEHLGWTGFFGALVGAGDCPNDKPSREPVDRALKPLALAPGSDHGTDIWFVGDTDIDLLCGWNSGCRPVLVRAEPPTDGEFADCPPELHMADCGALLRYIQML
jgi:phosphoglycolate phosphatase